MKKLCIPFLVITLITAQNLSAQHEAHQKNLKSEYAGQEKRTIKSLSESDIEELREGKGWGFAKAAELNGVPGPLHLLEMKSEIELSEDQIGKIEAIYKEMKKEAIALGSQLIKAEEALNISFAQKMINKKELRESLLNIGKITSELRFVHLQAHLETLKILTEVQVTEYNEIRGYDSKDPCENVPEGHDAEMWKKHNNCGS
jgi:hypothetical protein